jgi:hypothetical protein
MWQANIEALGELSHEFCIVNRVLAGSAFSRVDTLGEQ